MSDTVFFFLSHIELLLFQTLNSQLDNLLLITVIISCIRKYQNIREHIKDGLIWGVSKAALRNYSILLNLRCY